MDGHAGAAGFRPYAVTAGPRWAARMGDALASGDPLRWRWAARQAALAAAALGTLPALVLGLAGWALGGWTMPALASAGGATVLGLVAALMALSGWWTQRELRRQLGASAALPARWSTPAHLLLQAAVQGSSVVLVPVVVGCACFGSPGLWLACWLLAAAGATWLAGRLAVWAAWAAGTHSAG